MKKGFTLLELIVVIIILGILATLGFTQYTNIVEKGRTTEAKVIMGTIRTAEWGYHLQYDRYTGSFSDLGIDNVPTSCTSTNYFRYELSNDASPFRCWAWRCTSGGKKPDLQGTQYYLGLYYDAGTGYCSYVGGGSCPYW